jgi:hypothetical protein
MVVLLRKDRLDADKKVLRARPALILKGRWKDPVTQCFQIPAELERAGET